MEKFPYRDPDKAFGQVMLTLRDALGLTQAALAVHLGVSRRTVGDWETGNKYPKVAHLKEFIALMVQRGAFATGREAGEIRALWRAAHQKVLVDEAWLTSILFQRPPATTSQLLSEVRVGSRPVPVPAPSSPYLPIPSSVPTLVTQRETAKMIAAVAPAVEALTSPEREPFENASSSARMSQAPDSHAPRVDWGSAPSAPNFYGRGWEIDLLTEWVVKERCRVVSVLGLGGIGKSALAVSLMRRIAEQFEVIVWRSLRDLPTSEALLSDLLHTLTPPGTGLSEVGLPLGTGASTGVEQHLSALLERLRQTRVLLVLDNLQSVLAEGEGTGHVRPGYEGFGRFLERVAETEHQSCVLLTSREKPSDLVPQEGSHSPVRALRLARLDSEACEALLVEKGVKGTVAELAQLIEAYAGNPLALIIVSRTIADLFDGDLALFLEQGETIYGGVRQLLSEQFSRLSELEQSLLTWLAIMREPTTFDRLRSMLVTPFPPGDVLDAFEGLHRRNLIERGPEPGSFTLQSVVLEYVTAVLLFGGKR